MIEAYKKFWTNYANFNGRTSLEDYWWVVLCNFIVSCIIGAFYSISNDFGSFLSCLYGAATIVPNIAIGVRRLHDINKSGYYYFMILIPLAGPIIFLVYMLSNAINEGNIYGDRV